MLHTLVLRRSTAGRTIETELVVPPPSSIMKHQTMTLTCLSMSRPVKAMSYTSGVEYRGTLVAADVACCAAAVATAWSVTRPPAIVLGRYNDDAADDGVVRRGSTQTQLRK